MDGLTALSGCSYDKRYIWSSTPCNDGQTTGYLACRGTGIKPEARASINITDDSLSYEEDLFEGRVIDSFCGDPAKSDEYVARCCADYLPSGPPTSNEQIQEILSQWLASSGNSEIEDNFDGNSVSVTTSQLSTVQNGDMSAPSKFGDYNLYQYKDTVTKELRLSADFQFVLSDTCGNEHSFSATFDIFDGRPRFQRSVQDRSVELSANKVKALDNWLESHGNLIVGHDFDPNLLHVTYQQVGGGFVPIDPSSSCKDSKMDVTFTINHPNWCDSEVVTGSFSLVDDVPPVLVTPPSSIDIQRNLGDSDSLSSWIQAHGNAVAEDIVVCINIF